MWALIIILGIALVIIFLLLCPVTFKIKYTDELVAWARYLFFYYDLLEEPEESAQKEKSQQSKEKSHALNVSPEEKHLMSDIKRYLKIMFNKLKRDGLDSFLQALEFSVKRVKEVPVYFLKHIVIKKLKCTVAVASDDAAETAVSYGRACSYIYPIISVVTSYIKYKKLDINLYPDFDKKEDYVDIDLNVKIRMIYLISTLVKYSQAKIEAGQAFRRRRLPIDKNNPNNYKQQAKDGAKV